MMPTWKGARQHFKEVCVKFDILAETDGWGGCPGLRAAHELREHIDDILGRGSKNGYNYFKHSPLTVYKLIGALEYVVDAEVIRHDRICPKRQLDGVFHSMDSRVRERLAQKGGTR